MTIADIQRALKAQGHDPGPVDGAWGRRTIAALKHFQAAKGLTVDGIPGPKTIAALQPAAMTGSSLLTRPVWFAEAERFKGLHEVAGPASNPTILGWAKSLSRWVASVYKSDATPWCGLFVGHVIATVLPNEPLPTNPLSALAWAKFGTSLPAPSIGAICVFKRKGGGHVGFYAGEDETAVHVLGGNQSDAVTATARVSKERLVGYRWPATAPKPSSGRVSRAAGEPLSINEA